jgi:hypothetical protein
MPVPTLAALAAALATLAAPPTQEKQSWGSTMKPHTNAEFLPHGALVEVDGEAKGRGFVHLEIADPKRTFKVRVSAEGFEPEEAVVEASRVAAKDFVLALRPAGYERKVDAADASSMALAASALLRAGRDADAGEYAEQSLRTGNTPLANRVLGDVWRKRGDRDQATRYYTMYLSITDHPADEADVRAYLLQDKPGDMTLPAKQR